MAAGVHGPSEHVAGMRNDRGDPGSDGPFPDDERSVPADDRGMADAHAIDVRDGVVRAGPASPDHDPEIASSHLMPPPAPAWGVAPIIAP
jgi:hypothetical protein